jgi:hypothetical protein
MDYYPHFVEKLQKKIPFAFSRFGDGEFNCIFGEGEFNCDGHQYFPELRSRLCEILLLRPEYTIGIQRMARRRWEGDEEFATLTGFPTISADIFHHQNVKPGSLTAFFDALRTRRVVLVGPSYLGSLTRFGFHHIRIPEKNCWLQFEEIFDKCRTWQYPDQVFLLCASMPAKVLLHDLWTLNKGCTYIDLGSALDPHVGIPTRKYHKQVMKIVGDTAKPSYR